MSRRFPRFLLRFVFEVTFVIAGGLAGCLAVYAGEASQWPGFNLQQGFWGTHFLDKMFYAARNNTDALRMVSATWSVYTILIAVGLVLVARLYCRPGRPSRHGRRKESPAA